MSRAAPSYALRSLPFGIHPRQPLQLHSTINFRQTRQSSTVKATSGRKLSITRGTPATRSECACDIQFPKGLEIDRTRPLINTVAAYNQHVIIATGKNDWDSRIENQEGIGDMARALKEITKRKGGRCDLFPHFLHFPRVDNTPSHQNYLTSAYLGDQTHPPDSTTHPPPSFPSPQPITKPTILICSHGSRDARCGILGPLLYDEFLQHAQPGAVDVAMISHVGGHAFAGNVIVYIPPSYLLSSNADLNERGAHGLALAGMGIWYGRVEPRHVQSVLEETVEKGNVIGELWRGGLDVGATRDVEDWRSRTAGARILRIPSDILERDGMAIEEESR
ncbi:MAG: hypothetical protein Q9211_004475 [Gyalolechia sp. 1 TL-2023]